MLMLYAGDYEDRRNRTKIDCSKTIWILATNALDPKIKDFYDQNDKIFVDSEPEEVVRLTKQLSKTLKQEFLNIFEVSEPPPLSESCYLRCLANIKKSPLTGRISTFL